MAQPHQKGLHAVNSALQTSTLTTTYEEIWCKFEKEQWGKSLLTCSVALPKCAFISEDTKGWWWFKNRLHYWRREYNYHTDLRCTCLTIHHYLRNHMLTCTWREWLSGGLSWWEDLSVFYCRWGVLRLSLLLINYLHFLTPHRIVLPFPITALCK